MNYNITVVLLFTTTFLHAKHALRKVKTSAYDVFRQCEIVFLNDLDNYEQESLERGVTDQVTKCIRSLK